MGGSCTALLTMLLLSSMATAMAAMDWAAGASEAKAKSRQLTEEQWHSALHRLSGLELDDHSVSDLLGPVMHYKYDLPLPQVRKSLVYTGSNFRLRRVVHDMMMGGRTIKVGAIGGSITHGAKASVIGETDWFSLVGTYLKEAFPRANITTRNGALPATPSALMNMCLENYVDADVDLVFVEYIANDGANRWVTDCSGV